jgi:Protein of unknown function (DUF2996)
MVKKPSQNTEDLSTKEPKVELATSKQEKPRPVEEKSFTDFIQQDYIPALSQTFIEKEVSDFYVGLEYAKIAVNGFEAAPECSQVIGCWDGGTCQFNIYFFEDDIQGKRAISCTSNRNSASTIESFLALERKITLDLLILWLVQRLINQRWLS